MTVDRRSRYAKTPRVTWTRTDGSSVELLALTPRPDRDSVFAPVATDSDRLDRLASRYYRDANKLWKIADAADVMDPFDAIRTGAPVRVPPDR